MSFQSQSAATDTDSIEISNNAASEQFSQCVDDSAASGLRGSSQRGSRCASLADPDCICVEVDWVGERGLSGPSGLMGPRKVGVCVDGDSSCEDTPVFEPPVVSTELERAAAVAAVAGAAAASNGADDALRCVADCSTDEPLCSICLEPYSAEHPASANSCGHCFHFVCLVAWQQRSNACPLCLNTVACVADDGAFVFPGAATLPAQTSTLTHASSASSLAAASARHLPPVGADEPRARRQRRGRRASRRSHTPRSPRDIRDRRQGSAEEYARRRAEQRSGEEAERAQSSFFSRICACFM